MLPARCYLLCLKHNVCVHKIIIVGFVLDHHNSGDHSSHTPADPTPSRTKTNADIQEANSGSLPGTYDIISVRQRPETVTYILY